MVYVALPNHLHVEWCLKAMDAGKHVLCEKPLAMNAREAEPLIAARERTGVLIEEAFQIRNHPQWAALRDLIDSGEIGAVRGVQALMCYNNRNPADIRNKPETGGGALYDIGSYAVTGCRMAFGAEPTRALGLFEHDPDFGTDRLASAILRVSRRPGDDPDLDAGRARDRRLASASRTDRREGLGADGLSLRAFGAAPCHLFIGGTSSIGSKPARDDRVRAGQPVRAAGRALLAAGARRERGRRSRSSSPSPTCACSTRCAAPARAATWEDV